LNLGHTEKGLPCFTAEQVRVLGHRFESGHILEQQNSNVLERHYRFGTKNLPPELAVKKRCGRLQQVKDLQLHLDELDTYSQWLDSPGWDPDAEVKLEGDSLAGFLL
jgi:hypothetical protein